ncbi:hypothetical protein RRG08_044320 [Elysia crispata]|uniref:Uncharacterized protein n=1 Tax=Elysia crispata TaxID=231223 RepID=A0AAE0ZBD1_9GAST|nr:hypothetical protein RRG08_044320 [Elysia crispata]
MASSWSRPGTECGPEELSPCIVMWKVLNLSAGKKTLCGEKTTYMYCHCRLIEQLVEAVPQSAILNGLALQPLAPVLHQFSVAYSRPAPLQTSRK